MRPLEITKRQGEVLDLDGISRWLDAALSSMPNDVRVLSMTRPRKHRTNDQNALMWLWFSCIEDETGTDRQTVHDYYCTKFLRRNTTINGKDVTIVTGTSGLDTETMTYFLNKVQADAATEMGIRLPSPEDREYEEFLSYYGGR